MLIVGIALRAVLAPIVTVLSAGIAFLISQHLLGWLEANSGLAMPSELQGVAVALMLGIVTDYSVFYFASAREALRDGLPSREAVRRSTLLNTPIVFTAGAVVSFGVASLMLGTLGFFRSFGPGMALTVATGLLVSVLLVPAMLRLLGPALFWPGLRQGPLPVRRWRKRVAHLATRKPVALLLALAVVVVLAAAASGLRGGLPLGLQLVEGLPSSNPVAVSAHAGGQGLRARRDRADRAAPAGSGDPEPGRRARPARGGPAAAAARRGRDRRGRPAGRQAVRRRLRGPGRSSALRDHLRQRPDRGARDCASRAAAADAAGSAPPASGSAARPSGWGGETALATETVQATDTSLWRVVAVAFAVNFVFLLLFLRSLLAPLYLLAASALALAATLGLTVYFFTEVLHDSGLPYYIPVAFSVLLLSLGSDYNIFVVGRVWKEAERRPLQEAVAVAVPRAGRAITVAGVALALSFAMLAIIPITPFAVMAFAMGVGILIDTFLVRSVLVPALIVVCGRGGRWPRGRREYDLEDVSDPATAPLQRQIQGRRT